MEKEDIKKKLHDAIDAIESEELLQSMLMLMEPQAAYKTTNWFEDLDDIQLDRLNKSIEQADKGEFIPHESVKAKYSKWLK